MDRQDREAARRALAAVGGRLVRLVRAADPDAQVGDSDWRVADVVVHLAHVFLGFGEAAGGTSGQFARYVSDEPDFHTRLAGVNGTLIAEFDGAGRSLSEAIEMVESGIGAFLAATARLDPAAALETPWYGLGVTRTPDTLTALALGEVLVHGLDIARATGEPWRIERAEAAVVADEVFVQMLPLMLTDAGRQAELSYRIHWRGTRSPGLVVRLSRGAATVARAGRRESVDCRLWADPAAFLLVGYGRSGTWREVAAGRILAWGRRPWIATRLPELFCRP
ncbi:hypothetical protein P3T36_006493 [Kitasatospora sp. MAP12-15]|uniref:maleylpyruvate isomerase N-terminal domain-containing protein n=1 Tax=unclassified Kitasatospora TaxID=2633591 RepID=UPI002475D80A|nr:maleylpyruvate isomerase N-terminal domain-containing protein [Kitasatospora sp. MAP12-44]MDH6114983.1 hypothetical protein [Kitasatospora sp. MAP12-44]